MEIQPFGGFSQPPSFNIPGLISEKTRVNKTAELEEAFKKRMDEFNKGIESGSSNPTFRQNIYDELREKLDISFSKILELIPEEKEFNLKKVEDVISPNYNDLLSEFVKPPPPNPFLPKEPEEKIETKLENEDKIWNELFGMSAGDVLDKVKTLREKITNDFIRLHECDKKIEEVHKKFVKYANAIETLEKLDSKSDEIINAFKIDMDKWLESINLKDTLKEYKELKKSCSSNAHVIENLSSFNDGHTCGICKDRSVAVVAVPCGHTFCSECVEDRGSPASGVMPMPFTSTMPTTMPTIPSTTMNNYLGEFTETPASAGLNSCPYCKKNIDQTIKFYLS